MTTLSNLIASKGYNELAQRHSDRLRIKPEGTEYLYQDGNTDRKYHHIVINDDGETFYNQSIKYDAIVHQGRTLQDAGFQDFYEWQLVGCMEWHGYRAYLDAAHIEENDRLDRMARSAHIAAVRALRIAEAHDDAEARRTGKLTDRIAQAKVDGKKTLGAPYMVAGGMAIGHLDATGELGGEKVYIDRYTQKEMRHYILQNQGEGFTYFVEGEIDGADNFYQWVNRNNCNSEACGDWDCAGWLDAREYWDVELTQAEIAKLTKNS